MADAAGPDDQGLLNVGAAARPRDDGHLRRPVFGVFSFHGLERCPHSRHDLLCSGIHEEDVGDGIGLAGLGERIGEDDAARLRHEALATRAPCFP